MLYNIGTRSLVASLLDKLKLGEGDIVWKVIQTKMCYVAPIAAVVGLGALHFRERDLFLLNNLYNKS